MKYSGVGGQAVMEGILMRNADRVAIAIRKTDGEIELKEEKYRTVGGSDRLRKIPFVRGPFLMIDSLKLGLGAIQYSASFFMEEEEEKQSFLEKHFSKETADTITTVLTVVLALGLALALFLVLPVLIAGWLRPLISSRFGISLIEGLLRVGSFSCMSG